MRTMSALRVLCAWPEVIDTEPKRSRDEAAARGTRFHQAAQLWVMTGDRGHFDALEDPERTWLNVLADTWTPPDGLEMEVVLGLREVTGKPVYVPCKEDPPESHVYVSRDGQPMLTAGRADFVAPAASGLLNVDDIKTGKTYLGRPGHITQVLAQGIAATLRANAPGFIPGVYYARTNSWDRDEPIYRETPAWLKAWDQVRAAASLPSQPIPGGWCLSCWSKGKCTANPELRAG